MTFIFIIIFIIIIIIIIIIHHYSTPRVTYCFWSVSAAVSATAVLPTLCHPLLDGGKISYDI